MSDDGSAVTPMDSDGNARRRGGVDADLNFFDAMEVIYFDDMMSSSTSEGAIGGKGNDEDDDDGGEFLRKDEVKKKLQLRGSGGGMMLNSDSRARLRDMARERRMKLEDEFRSRRKKMRLIMNEPAFVMRVDKLSFVCGVLIIMIIEAVLLLSPERMHLLYTILLVPLMIARYVTYRADMQHYFMYDFCYFAQVLLVLHMYVYPNNVRLGRALFSISNGPLLLAIVMWRNSIVFHSFDKMTSMFIHILPPLVTFCDRWAVHLSDGTYPPYEEMDDSISTIVNDFWLVPFSYYVVWQTAYLFKTEVISRKKLEYNTEMMTSLRFLTRKKNSKSYKLMSAFGEHNQLPTFVLIQAVFTMVTFLVRREDSVRDRCHRLKIQPSSTITNLISTLSFFASHQSI